ncbi:hypothetical protein ACSBR1_007158 [Camellia fascicularis]
MARVPLICFDVVEWHLPDRVLRKFGRVQSVPDRFDTEWQLHVTDRRGRAGTDWHLFYMPYIQLWDARRDSIVQADYSDEVIPSSDPYMLWYRRHTHLLVGNPSHVSESGYQGVGPYLEALVARAGRSFHLAEDTHLRRDGQHALQAVAEIRELLYQAFQVAHRGDRLHYGHYGVHTSAAAPNTSTPSTSAPSTSAPATSAPSTSVTPPHTTPYISADSLDVLPTQHTGIPYVPDPDWTPPRYMHDVVTPSTQLPPSDSSTATMSTHDAVLPDISYVDAEAHIEPPQSARERPRGRGQGPAADRDTVAPDDGVSQLTAVSDLRPQTGSGTAHAIEGGSHSQASQDTHLRLGAPDIQRVYRRRPRREVHGRGCGTGGRLGH